MYHAVPVARHEHHSPFLLQRPLAQGSPLLSSHDGLLRHGGKHCLAHYHHAYGALQLPSAQGHQSHLVLLLLGPSASGTVLGAADSVVPWAFIGTAVSDQLFL